MAIETSKKNQPVNKGTGNKILTAYTASGKKVFVFEYRDTLFGHINHVWKYEKEEKVRTFGKRVSRHELTIGFIKEYFSKVD